ncbi:MAG: tetratricopeptide repeat protein [Candidatus Omnitrophica bacterium]|nr:tetratricopeptide repeat protein [Candidatus Omnitrophota bacterium]
MSSLLNLNFSRKEFFFIILSFLLAFSLRLIYLVEYRKIEFYYPVLENSDSYYYLNWAKKISEGEVIGEKVFMKWPFYAYYLAILLKIFNYNLLYVIFFQLFLGALNCISIYLIARKLFNKFVGGIAVIFYISYGLFIFYEGLFIYTGLSIFLNLLLFLYLLYLRENLTNDGLILAAVLLGISILTQANIVIFGILAVLTIILEKRMPLRMFIYNLTIFFIVFSVILGIVCLRNYLVEKDWVLISGHLGFNFYLGNNPKNMRGLFYYPFYINPNQESMFRDARILARIHTGRELKPSEVSNFWLKRAIKFIIKNPLIYLRIQLNKLLYLFSPYEYVHDWEFFGLRNKIELFKYLFLDLRFIMSLFYLGVIWTLKDFKRYYLLYMAVFLVSFSLIIFFVATRYRMSLVSFLIIFAAFGFYKLIGLFIQRAYLKFLSVTAIVIMIISVFNKSFKKENSFNAEANFSLSLEKIMYYKNKGDYQSALKETETIYNVEAENPLILNILGEIYFNLNDLEKAEEMYKKIIIKYPFFVDAYYNLGLIYNRQGLFSKAKEILIEALTLDPAEAQIHFELGKAYKNLGERLKAKEEFWFVLNKIDLNKEEERKKIEKELLDLIE